MNMRGPVASWLVRSSPDRAVWVRALAGDIVLCSRARRTLLSRCLLHPGVYIIQGGVEILPVASCYRNWDKLRPDEPLGSYTDVTNALTLHSDANVYAVTLKELVPIECFAMYIKTFKSN